jgi:hypothetical protein
MITLERKASTRKYIVDSNSFLSEDKTSYYLLGAYMTDGSLNTRKRNMYIDLSSADKDWLENIRHIICSEKPIYNSKDNCYSFQFSDIDCMNWLNDYGCTPKKSLTLTINKPIPKEYQMDFIRGVIDGDGCMTQSPYVKKKAGKEYHYTKKVIYICSASLKFLEQIKSFIPDDINCVIANHGRKNCVIKGKPVIGNVDIYRLIFNDSNAVKLAKLLYYKEGLLSLKRKEMIARTWFSNTN